MSSLTFECLSVIPCYFYKVALSPFPKEAQANSNERVYLTKRKKEVQKETPAQTRERSPQQESTPSKQNRRGLESAGTVPLVAHAMRNDWAQALSHDWVGDQWCGGAAHGDDGLSQALGEGCW